MSNGNGMGHGLGPEEIAQLRALADEVREDDDVPEDWVLPDAGMEKLIRQHRGKLTGTMRAMLKRSVAPDDRSAAMHGLAKDLLRVKVPPTNVAMMLRELQWNKFAGRRDETKQLWREVHKAQRALESEVGASANGAVKERRQHAPKSSLRDATIDADSFLIKEIARPSWLVEGIWTRGTVGFIAGMAKTYKSTVATDLGLSVATGTPFMGHFEVHDPGPVIMVQEENDEGLQQDRLRRMMKSRGISVPSMRLEGDLLHMDPGSGVPFHFVNNYGFDLGDGSMVEELEEMVQDIKPKLLIMDPLYLLAGVDADVMSLKDMTEVIRWMVHMKTRYGCAVTMVHHFKKSTENHVTPMERMTGSAGLSYGFDCALLMEPLSGSLKCNRLFRHWRREPFEFDVFMTEDLEDYEVKVSDGSRKDDNHPLMDLVLAHAAQGLTLPDAVKTLGITRQAVVKAARTLPIRLARRSGKSGGKPTIVMYPDDRKART